MEKLLPKAGGYRRLHSWRVAQLVYDVTVRFCEDYVDRFSRTRDQMVQAARSGVRNIEEGSIDSATSKKSELKLTNIARGSLGELRSDYEDFLRQRELPLWSRTDPRRQALVNRRCTSAQEVLDWVHSIALEDRSTRPMRSIRSLGSLERVRHAETLANAGHVLAGVAFCLLDRQVASLARAFERQGGFGERMYRVRKEQQGQRVRR